MKSDDLSAFFRDLGSDTKSFVQKYVAKENAALAADLRREINGRQTANEADRFADTMIQTIKGALAPVIARLDAAEQEAATLTKQLEEVSSRPTGLRYCGVWVAGAKYRQDDGVTHDGCLWVAKRSHVMSEPTEDPTSWQLAVKRGRDARDRERKDHR